MGPRPLRCRAQRVALLSVSVATIGFWSVPVVNAQTTEDPNAKYIHGPNTRHWGPFYVTPRISATGGWDTNVDYSQDNPFRDSGFVMNATAEVLLPVGRRFRIIGSGTLTPNYFTNVESARSFDRSGQLRAELDIGRLTPFGLVGAGREKQRFSTEVDDRLWRDQAWKGGGVIAHLTRKVQLSGSWVERTYDFEEGVLVNDSEVAQSLNRRSRELDFSFDYRLTRRTSLTASADVIDDRFVGTPTAPLNDTIRSYRYLGGVSFSPASRIQGQVLAGWRHYPLTSGNGAPSYNGPTFQVQLQIPFVGDGLTLSAIRDIHYAVEQAPTISGSQRNSFVSGNYTASAGVDLPLSLIARVLGGLQRSDFLLPYSQEGAPYVRVDNVWSAGGSLLRRVGSRLAIGGTATHNWRSTNAVGKNYQDTRYGFTVEAYP